MSPGVEALLDGESSDLEASGGPPLSARASGSKVSKLLLLSVQPDGGIFLAQAEERSPSPCSYTLAAIFYRGDALPDQIPAADVVGATSAGAELTIWHAPLANPVLQQSPPRRCFSFLSVSFGLITNLDIGTEHLRCLGGTRFVLGALHQILLKKKHSAMVALLEPEAAAQAAVAAPAPPPPGQGSDGQRALAAAAAGAGPPVLHLAAFQALAAQQLPPAWQWLPDPDVSLFTACNCPRLDMNFLLAPDATLDSGHYNLIYTPPASRREGFAVMTASEKGEHMSLVKQRRVAAMTLEPLSTGTWIVVDGEAMPFTPLFMEVHPQLCRTIVAPSSGKGGAPAGDSAV